MHNEDTTELTDLRATIRRHVAMVERIQRMQRRLIRARAAALAAQTLHDEVLSEVDEWHNRQDSHEVIREHGKQNATFH